MNRLWVSRDYKEGAKSDKTLFRILSFRIPMLKEKKNFLKVVGFIGREINVLSDSTSFYNIEIDSKQKLATNQISEIKFKGTGSSIFEGFLFGGIGGGLLGNFISNPSSPGLEKVISVGGGILVGGVIGIIVAIIYPNYTIMNFSGEQE